MVDAEPSQDGCCARDCAGDHVVPKGFQVRQLSVDEIHDRSCISSRHGSRFVVDDKREEHLAGQRTMLSEVAVEECERRVKSDSSRRLTKRDSQIGVVVDGLARFCVESLIGHGQRHQVGEVKVV
jgi:hypothetical protein